jgi:hypothetical protein
MKAKKKRKEGGKRQSGRPCAAEKSVPVASRSSSATNLASANVFIFSLILIIFVSKKKKVKKLI